MLLVRNSKYLPILIVRLSSFSDLNNIENNDNLKIISQGSVTMPLMRVAILTTECTRILTIQTHPRSSPIMPFDRPYMISYLSSILTMSLSCTVSEIANFQKFKDVTWLWLVIYCQKQKSSQGHRSSIRRPVLDHFRFGTPILLTSSHVHFRSGGVLKTVLDKDVKTTVHKQEVICRTAI